jgi:S-DNA-T family DNA segregation ATPase FtsK/SpoIIIE
VLLILDGYSAFREKTDNQYENRLIELVRDGASLGVFVCIAAGGFGTGELQAKIADKMRQTICLEMESKYAYGDCLRTMRFEVLPESGVCGRGLAPCGDSILEFQTALAADGDDYRRGETLRAECARLAAHWHGNRAPAIPEVPEKPTWEIFSALEEYQQLCADSRYLPVAYLQKDASIYSINLSNQFCYTISGREKTGKSVFLRNVACAARDSGAKIYLIDRIDDTGEKRTAVLTGAEYINTTAQIFEFMKVLIPLTNERNTRLKALKEQGLEGQELFEQMQEFQQIVVLIADLANFVEACGKPADGHAAIASNVEVIVRKGAQLQLYFFGAVNTEDATALSVKPIYTAFIQNKQGVHLGGELTKQKVISYKNLSFNEQTRVRKVGTGMVPDEEDSTNAAEIIIPMNKGILPKQAKTADGGAD